MPPKKAVVTASALRHRRYIEKLKNDPEAHANYLRKQRQKYKERKRKGGLQLIKEKSDREQRVQRRLWRKNQSNCRKLKNREATVLTPPGSPEDDGDGNHGNDGDGNVQRRRGRPRIRDPSRSKAYRKISNLENTVKEKERAISRLNKRCQRLQKKLISNSPGSRTKVLMGSACSKIKQKKDVKKTLLFHHALLDNMGKLKSNKLGQKTSSTEFRSDEKVSLCEEDP